MQTYIRSRPASIHQGELLRRAHPGWTERPYASERHMFPIEDSAVREQPRTVESPLTLERAILLGRVFIGIPMVAFGVQQLVYGDFVTRAIPRLPAWVPLLPLMPYLTGAGLIA